MSPVSRGISFHESLLYSLHRLADAAVICFAARLALGKTTEAGMPQLLTISAATILVFHFVAEISGLYRSWRGSRLRREIGCVILTWCQTVPVLLGIGLVTQHNAGFSYETKLIWIFTTPAAMVAARVVLRKIQQRLRARGFNIRSCAICGVNELGVQLARNVERSPEMGLRLGGFYDDRPLERTTELPRDVGRRVGGVDELVHRARRGDFDIVYITFPMRAEERISSVLAKLADTTASVYIVQQLEHEEIGHYVDLINIFSLHLHGNQDSFLIPFHNLISFSCHAN
jgi:putative colanic acid biosynthesis UDP-glucose lipid carrier transferase